MTTNHAYFEVMCALAASGQLTKTEQVELREHSEHCVLCRNRLLEMRQSGFQLFLARAFKTPSKRLPKGMQERFAARAISEGIPLTSRSAGSGFHALGMVTVLLLVLLLVAAALQDGPFTRPAVEMDVADTSHVSGFLEKEKISSQNIPNHTLPGKVRASRVLDRQSQLPASPVSRATGPRRLYPADPAPRVLQPLARSGVCRVRAWDHLKLGNEGAPQLATICAGPIIASMHTTMRRLFEHLAL